MEESISKVRKNSNSCLRLPILHPWKRIAVLRCVSVFDSILWTRCLLQRLNVSSGFSVFKVILAFSGFNFLRLLFICFFRYNGKQFLFPCSSFQKKLQGDMRARYDISSILQCFFFFCSSIAWTQLPHACFCFIPIDRCSCQSTKTFYLKAKGTWWKKVWPKRALCSWGYQLRYLTTVTLHKIFPLFSFTNMYIPRHNFTIFFAYQRHFINRALFIFVVSLTIVFEWQSAFCLYAKSFIKLLWDPLFFYKKHKVTVITPPWSIFKMQALH